MKIYLYLYVCISADGANKAAISMSNNYDIENVITPVDADVLERLLIESDYDQEETQFIVDGFRKGFDLGYAGPERVKITAPNLKLKQPGDEIVLWNKVMKEVKLGRFAGPYEHVPFEFFIQSPIGLVPKDNGKDSRLIFHLSYPRGTGQSVNANIPKEKCTVKYPDFADAIALCLVKGKYCRISR